MEKWNKWSEDNNTSDARPEVVSTVPHRRRNVIYISDGSSEWTRPPPRVRRGSGAGLSIYLPSSASSMSFSGLGGPRSPSTLSSCAMLASMRSSAERARAPMLPRNGEMAPRAL